MSEHFALATFPLDLLGEIFKKALATNSSSNPTSRITEDSKWRALTSSSTRANELGSTFITPDAFQSRLKTLLTLCHVCTRWRCASFSISELWNTLAWSCEPPWLEICRNDGNFLGWWSDKVKGNSLTLQLDIKEHSDDGDSIFLRPTGAWIDSKVTYTDNVAQLSSELQVVILDLMSKTQHLSMDPYFFLFLWPGHGEYPHLRTLHLQGHYNDAVLAQHHAALDFKFDQVPFLKSLFLNEYPFCLYPFSYTYTYPHPQTPPRLWNQLTNLTAVLSTTPVCWLHFIKECVSLVTARFSFEISDTHYIHGPETNIAVRQNDTLTVLGSLQNLHIHVYQNTRQDGRSFVHLFHLLHLPALEELSLKGDHLSLEDLHTMLQVTPQLRRLSVAAVLPVPHTADAFERRLLAFISVNNLGFPLPSAFGFTSDAETQTTSAQSESEDSDDSDHGDNDLNLHPLSHYVPDLEFLTLQLLPTHAPSLLSYMRQMIRSGWLRGMEMLAVRLCLLNVKELRGHYSESEISDLAYDIRREMARVRGRKRYSAFPGGGMSVVEVTSLAAFDSDI